MNFIDKPINSASSQRIAVAGEKVVNLALQGGGSHGAFTWGVLDRLLEQALPVTTSDTYSLRARWA
jgi:predicted acylesterase/phospholipase RssA